MKRYNRIARLMTLLLMTGLLLGLAAPALAQDGGGIGGALDSIVTAITECAVVRRV